MIIHFRVNSRDALIPTQVTMTLVFTHITRLVVLKGSTIEIDLSRNNQDSIEGYGIALFVRYSDGLA